MVQEYWFYPKKISSLTMQGKHDGVIQFGKFWTVKELLRFKYSKKISKLQYNLRLSLQITLKQCPIAPSLTFSRPLSFPLPFSLSCSLLRPLFRPLAQSLALSRPLPHPLSRPLEPSRSLLRTLGPSRPLSPYGALSRPLFRPLYIFWTFQTRWTSNVRSALRCFWSSAPQGAGPGELHCSRVCAMPCPQTPLSAAVFWNFDFKCT